MNIIYDVTAISHDDERVPLTAGTTYTSASEIARPRSRDAHWSAVEIRYSDTGALVEFYVNGVELFHLRECAQQVGNSALRMFCTNAIIGTAAERAHAVKALAPVLVPDDDPCSVSPGAGVPIVWTM
jgi:hypothetical protein